MWKDKGNKIFVFIECTTQKKGKKCTSTFLFVTLRTVPLGDVTKPKQGVEFRLF